MCVNRSDSCPFTFGVIVLQCNFIKMHLDKYSTRTEIVMYYHYTSSALFFACFLIFLILFSCYEIDEMKLAIYAT